MTRVVVTGIGVVSPLGRGSRATMQALLEGRRAIGPLTLFDLPGARSSIAAQTDVVAEAGSSRADTMAILACREALAEARLDGAGMALFVGGTTAGMFECESSLARLTRDPSSSFDRAVMRCQPLDAPANRLHETFGPFASTQTICSACSGGAIALMLAASAIRSGRVDRALAGGVDALSRLSYAGFASLGALDHEPCRPFDAARSGLTLGEAAAFLVLESERSARERGATVLCELSGWAAASEAHHVTHPEPDGRTASAVMRDALASAGLERRELDYVNAHGTGTPHNDAMEAAAIRAFLGEDVERVGVSSVKGALGHTLAAAGAIEAAVAALSVVLGEKPPTAGLVDPDPRCALRHLSTAERGRVRAALSNAFGFGGTDVTLVFSEIGLARPREVERRTAVVTGAAHASAPREERIAVPADALDPMRARRMEPAARLFTWCATRAIAEAGVAEDVAIVAGSAWGSPAATGKFLVELFEKGPRFASPATFPGSLPSALASNASIYLGARGVAFTTADAATSAESAIATAVALVEQGEAPAVLCGGVEEQSDVARLVSSPVACGIADRGRRGEGAGAFVVEAAESARARGAQVLAEVAFARSWRGARPDLPAPSCARAAVYLAREDLEVPEAWARLPRHVASDEGGDHEAIGAVAFARAVTGDDDEVLVLGGGADRGHAFVLRRGNRG